MVIRSTVVHGGLGALSWLGVSEARIAVGGRESEYEDSTLIHNIAVATNCHERSRLAKL